MRQESLDLFDEKYQSSSSINLKAFSDKLSADEVLAKEYHDYVLLAEGIKYAKRQEMLALLKEVEKSERLKESSVPKGKHVFLKKSWMSIAAAIVLMIMTKVVFFNTPSSEELYTKYYQVYPNTLTEGLTRGDTKITESVLDKAMIAYDQGAYHLALELFTQVQGEESDILFYMGVSELETGNIAEALEYFSLVKGASDVSDLPVNWYLAMTYLRLNDKEKAKEYLSKISSSDPYHERSLSLLKEM